MDLLAPQARLIAGLFSRPVFRALAADHVPSSVRVKLAVARGALGVRGGTVGDFFDEAFDALLRDYRSEYVYKNVITKKLIFGIHSPKSAALLTEFWVNLSKADSVVLNGTSTVYEIKTEYDNLARLPQQLADYSKVFDRINVVTHEGAVPAVLALVPEHVGVIVLSRRNALHKEKQATSNIAQLDHWTIFNCLRKQEFVNILERQCGGAPDATPDVFRTRAFELFRQLPKDVMSAEFVREVRKRTTNSEVVDFTSQLPASLKTLGVSEQLSRLRRSKLLETLDSKLKNYVV
ncbi:sce7726 family protein [Pandoraea sputorum]|uniref:sce7726 family protein n=1 Tax=Pandoraea sputorum TaxID=93222 RepID=UPI001E64BCC1|nr:sce7726 family protein [Pandoraea sputorum]MCE4058725.1 sce7726 family protein [Pandoraea sputorum]